MIINYGERKDGKVTVYRIPPIGKYPATSEPVKATQLITEQLHRELMRELASGKFTAYIGWGRFWSNHQRRRYFRIRRNIEMGSSSEFICVAGSSSEFIRETREEGANF